MYASVVGPGARAFTVPKQVLIEGKSKIEHLPPHISNSPTFLSQAVTSKHNQLPEYTLGREHEAMSDWMSFQSESGPVKSITTGHVNQGQTTLLEMTDEAKKKYWFQEEVKVHMVPNLEAYLSALENYNKRHCPGSCVIEKFYTCSGSFWRDKGGCTAGQACCTGEVTDRAIQDIRVCSGKCFNEDTGKCTGVLTSPVKSASCNADSPLCCTVRGTLIPFVPIPSPPPVVITGLPPPPAPVDPFTGTKPRKGSNIDKTLQPNPLIQVGAFSGLRLKVAQLYNYFGGYISTKAAELAIKPHVLGGVIHHLSKGQFAFDSNGRMMIFFNVDHFWNNWGQWHEDKYVRHFGFNHDYPYKGQTCRVITLGPWKTCHKDQNMEWEMTRFAQVQNNYQAIRSLSLGVARIRGGFFSAAGYRSPVDMFLALSGSARAQLDAFTTLLKSPKHAWCLLGLRTEKLGMFANCYNGKNGRHGKRYVTRMKAAIKAYGDVSDVAD